MSDVSVVIVTHNALPWIEQSLASVQGVTVSSASQSWLSQCFLIEPSRCDEEAGRA